MAQVLENLPYEEQGHTTSTIAVDDLVMQAARASATMVLTLFSKIPCSALKSLVILI